LYQSQTKDSMLHTHDHKNCHTNSDPKICLIKCLISLIWLIRNGIYVDRLKSSWTHLITPSRNFIEVSPRTLQTVFVVRLNISIPQTWFTVYCIAELFRMSHIYTSLSCFRLVHLYEIHLCSTCIEKRVTE